MPSTRAADKSQFVKIRRRPRKGELPSLSTLHSFSPKFIAPERTFAVVEGTRKERSRFGPKAVRSDYAHLLTQFAEPLSKSVAHEVLGCLVDMINQVSQSGGEPMGNVDVKIARKVGCKQTLFRQQRREQRLRAQAAAASVQQMQQLKQSTYQNKLSMEARSVLFKELKRVLGPLAPYEDVYDGIMSCSAEQLETWLPQRWCTPEAAGYSGWLDSVADEGFSTEPTPFLLPEMEEDELFALQGLCVQTPLGPGIVVGKGSQARHYVIAVAATVPGTTVETPYGTGVVRAYDENTKVATVDLSFGTAYMHDVALLTEMVLAVPLDPWIAIRAKGSELSSILRFRFSKIDDAKDYQHRERGDESGFRDQASSADGSGNRQDDVNNDYNDDDGDNDNDGENHMDDHENKDHEENGGDEYGEDYHSADQANDDQVGGEQEADGSYDMEVE